MAKLYAVLAVCFLCIQIVLSLPPPLTSLRPANQKLGILESVPKVRASDSSDILKSEDDIAIPARHRGILQKIAYFLEILDVFLNLLRLLGIDVPVVSDMV